VSNLPVTALSMPPTGAGPDAARTKTQHAVLIAEDDPIFRRVIASWFKRWDYRVTVVDNGLDAWEILKHDDAPQMIVLDWMMPGVDGVELCRRIRSREGPYRYVLLLTANDNQQDVVTGLEAGADDYLTKPFDVDELHARARAGTRILDLQAALVQAHDALKFESAHDHLTTIWNRGAIMELLIKEVERRRRFESTLGVIMADLDFFKKINDTYGHLIGDAVLREAGRRLGAAVRTYDWVGRYGGEEFLIIAPGCEAADLVVMAERLRDCIGSVPIETTAGPIAVTLSLGVVAAPAQGRDVVTCETLLQAADAALYVAKERGRNRAELALATQNAVAGS